MHLREPKGRAPYQPISLADLGQALAVEVDERTRFRLLLEFLEEYRWEGSVLREELLTEAPPSTGDARWNMLLAGMAEHLSAAEGKAAPGWVTQDVLGTWWFLDDTPAGRAEALVTAPAALRSRGVFVAAADLGRA